MIHPRTLHSLEFGKIIQFLADLCISAQGRELANAVKPLQDREQAEAAFKLYEQAHTWLSSLKSGQYALAPFPDVRDIIYAAGDSGAARPAAFDVEAFWALREMLRDAQKAIASINTEQAPAMWPDLLDLALAHELPEQFLAALNRCISDDGLIKDESSPELYRLRSEMRAIHQNCIRKVKDFAQKYNILPWLQDEFITLASDRYVLPLKANFKGRIQGIIHDWSQTGETCYFEPMFLVEINNRLRELKHEERDEEKKVLDYLRDMLIENAAAIGSANRLLAALDFLNAKKLFAEYLHANCITFTSDDAGIELNETSHPGLILARQHLPQADYQPVRPIDIILRPGERVLVITGGNAGGKTVCLKTLGLNAALAMSGLPVPTAKGSHLPWFDRLDAFIGDEQSLAENVSTFTAQIDHLAKAWKHLDQKGLILLDEFGAGTDPAEGSALAQAVLDGLLEKNSFVLAATHFPALKSYALTRKGVRAASMLFNPETHKPLFRLAYDQVGASQALVVAAEHGLPDGIINRARHYLLQDGGDQEKLLGRLNELASLREREIERVKTQEAKSLAALEEKNKKLDKERARIKEELSGRITELMAAWKKEKVTARQAMKELSSMREGLKIEREDGQKSLLPQDDNFTAGQTVFHAGFNRSGVITEVDDKRKKARLDLNGVSLWADFKDIRQSSAAQPKKSSSVFIASSSAPAVMTLDVRGKRAEEALSEVEKFLNRAILAEYSEVEIIHGRGTGALRKQIHNFLRSFPEVVSFATAPEDRGGDGMTIVAFS